SSFVSLWIPFQSEFLTFRVFALERRAVARRSIRENRPPTPYRCSVPLLFAHAQGERRKTVGRDGLLFGNRIFGIRCVFSFGVVRVSSRFFDSDGASPKLALFCLLEPDGTSGIPVFLKVSRTSAFDVCSRAHY